MKFEQEISFWSPIFVGGVKLFENIAKNLKKHLHFFDLYAIISPANLCE